MKILKMRVINSCKNLKVGNSHKKDSSIS